MQQTARKCKWEKNTYETNWKLESEKKLEWETNKQKQSARVNI
jgi:hypothetical protein